MKSKAPKLYETLHSASAAQLADIVRVGVTLGWSPRGNDRLDVCISWSNEANLALTELTLRAEAKVPAGRRNRGMT